MFLNPIFYIIIKFILLIRFKLLYLIQKHFFFSFRRVRKTVYSMKRRCVTRKRSEYRDSGTRNWKNKHWLFVGVSLDKNQSNSRWASQWETAPSSLCHLAECWNIVLIARYFWNKKPGSEKNILSENNIINWYTISTAGKEVRE